MPYASVSVGSGIATPADVGDCGISSELACRDNEMAYMYWYNLGGVGGIGGGDNLTGNQTVIGADGYSFDLLNIQDVHWSGTGANVNDAWDFGFYKGFQQIADGSGVRSSAWAVHDGDIGCSGFPGGGSTGGEFPGGGNTGGCFPGKVPEPPAILLFGIGLIGLIGFSKRRKAA